MNVADFKEFMDAVNSPALLLILWMLYRIDRRIFVLEISSGIFTKKGKDNGEGKGSV